MRGSVTLRPTFPWEVRCASTGCDSDRHPALVARLGLCGRRTCAARDYAPQRAPDLERCRRHLLPAPDFWPGQDAGICSADFCPALHRHGIGPVGDEKLGSDVDPDLCRDLAGLGDGPPGLLPHAFSRAAGGGGCGDPRLSDVAGCEAGLRSVRSDSRAAESRVLLSRQNTGAPGLALFETGSGQHRKHNARPWGLPHYFIGEKSVGRMYVESTFSTVFSVCSDFTTA